MPQLRGSDGRDYRTQGELARGGEGAILSLQGRADVVAKLYLPGQATPAREAKLRAMVADPPRDEMRERGHAAIAWPLVVLRAGGRFAGYLMQRIDAARPLINAYNPRAKDALNFDWHGQHQVAANLCAALNALHVKGYVVGDLNPRNILVTAQGLVTLVDTDSFQVRANGTVHRCPVGTPEYTPRELQGQPFDRIDRAPEHDRFGLAVLVFQLLMGGFHPFTGALKDPRDSLPGKIDEWCIGNGVFPWRDHPRLRRPPAARPLEDLDPALGELFLRCFVSGHGVPALRPSALDWREALLASQQRLVRCAAGAHWRYPGPAPCHACQALPATARAAPIPGPQPPPPPRPQPPLQPTAQPPPPGRRGLARASVWWQRHPLAAAFGALALVLVFFLNNRSPQPPQVPAAAWIDQARAALARGDTAAAEQALKQAAGQDPALAAEFARDQAALYRELAQQARTRGDGPKAELAAAEAQRWEGASTAGQAKGPTEAEARAIAEAEAKAKAEAETKARAEADARAKAEAEIRAKVEAEAKAKAEAETKARVEAEARANAEAAAPLPASASPRQGPVGTIPQEMVAIPAGEFQMGCSPGDGQCDSDEKPPHPVKVKAFRIGKYEVTQAQWQAVMGENPARFKGEDRPVEQVSWNDIQTFLARLNAANPGKPYRLPTEAEWEYAARGGTKTPYWWGKDIGKGNANCRDCGSRWDGKETAPVGSFKPNPFGLYDTAGNVWEWVQDCWHPSYQGAPTDGSEWRDNCQGTSRVVRGGSWSHVPVRLRSAFRLWFYAAYRSVSVGFRLAQDL